MSRENGAPTFLAESPFGNAVQDPHKRLKFSYTREFLLSLAKSSACKLPMEAYLSNFRGFEDEPRLISPPYGDSDSRHDKSVPQHSAQEVPDNSNHLLHKSDEPYRPPRRYKALPPPSRKESSDTRNNETPMASDCMNLEKADSERLRRKGKYPSWSWLRSGIFLMSQASENFNTLVSTPNAITEQKDASQKSTPNQGSVRCERLQPSILQESINFFSSQHQLERDVTANNTVNLHQKPVNRIDDASEHFLSELEKSMQFKESGAYSNFNEGHPELETYRNLNKNQLEAAYEKGLMDLQLNDGLIHDQGSQGRIAKDVVREAYVSPPPVEDKKLLISMVDKCELDMVHCEGISSVHGVKQAVSSSMKQNISSPNFQIQPELESEFLSSLNESDSSIELSLPDEDSLITFEGPFLMPDEESRAFVDDSKFNPEKNPTEADTFNPTWQMIEKLVEFILDDESSPVSHLDTVVQHGAGMEGFCHSPHAQPSYTQLSPGRDQLAHNIFNRKSMNTTAYSSLTHHCLPPNKISQPLPFCHDELRRIDHDVSHPMIQQMVDPRKLHLCSFCGVQREVTQHRPTYQDYTSGYQEASYQGFIMPNPDFPAERNNNQAVVDSILDIEQRAGHWGPHPYVRGFW
ncbi:hypothetical protein L6164_005986 [Bauhinia variegata]|uniref:Uncharacterized protein n=1 Tax=Bauhinia variegata TaxID=167791 RepID=A0ACB9PYE4_BAUVA|nr:hypothetical protein L6164_005986 [Bauhinia variegata]